MVMQSVATSFIKFQWFDKKKIYLDTLEAQLRSLVKSTEVVAKQRIGMLSSLIFYHLWRIE